MLPLLPEGIIKSCLWYTMYIEGSARGFAMNHNIVEFWGTRIIPIRTTRRPQPRTEKEIRNYSSKLAELRPRECYFVKHCAYLDSFARDSYLIRYIYIVNDVSF